MKSLLLSSFAFLACGAAFAQSAPAPTPQQLRAAFELLQVEKAAAENRALKALTDLEDIAKELESVKKERDELKAAAQQKDDKK